MKNKEQGFSPWVWSIFFLLLWQVLLSAQNPGLMSDDSGEMAAASYSLGLPHPPGFPLFCLLGHLVAWLPLGTVAFRLNLLSAFLALLSVGFILDCCRRSIGTFLSWEASRILLPLLAVLLVSGRSLFAQCLTAKGCVYSLTLLLTTVLVWHWIKSRDNGGDQKSLFVPFFLWGLGLANHWPSQIFWAPFLLFVSWPVFRRAGLKPVIFAATLSLFGLSLYLYLPFRTLWTPEPCWGNPVHLTGFYWVVSRRLVAGLEPLIQGPEFYLLTLKELGRILFLFWPPWAFLLGVLGLLFVRERDRTLFNGLMILFVPTFMAVLAIHEEKNIYLVHAYLLSLTGIAGIFIFAGMSYFAVLKSFQKGRLPRLSFLVLALLSFFWLVRTCHVEDKSGYTLAEDFGTNALKCLPRGALFIADGDHYVMPIWYERSVLGLRPDILFEPSVFLYHGWGWKQLMDQSKDMEPLILSANSFVGRLNAMANKDKAHPFFYSLGTSYLAPVLTQVPGSLQPWGLVYRWDGSRESEGKRLPGPSWLIKAQRTRGIKYQAGSEDLDLSSRILLRYYAEQRAQAGQL